MVEPSERPLDAIGELLGIGLPPERMAENLAAYRDILIEIRKLRDLDLTEVHPVVSFDAGAAFEGGKR